MGSRSGLRVALAGLGLLFAGLALHPAPALAEGGETKKECRPVVDETQVYFGKASTCKAPAVVDADKVYRSIPEYKKIIDQKLSAKDAEYTILMVKVARKFRAAIAAAATEAGRDLVANVGSVTWEGHEIPELTEATIKKLDDKAGGG
jgi:CO dehydrogenase/acetyl-CoA synthase epsilon subunit